MLTFLRLRMKPLEEAPTKRGRSNGRQAPTIPIEDSTIAQYAKGEYISASVSETGDECVGLKSHTAEVHKAHIQFYKPNISACCYDSGNLATHLEQQC